MKDIFERLSEEEQEALLEAIDQEQNSKMREEAFEQIKNKWYEKTAQKYPQPSATDIGPGAHSDPEAIGLIIGAYAFLIVMFEISMIARWGWAEALKSTLYFMLLVILAAILMAGGMYLAKLIAKKLDNNKGKNG